MPTPRPSDGLFDSKWQFEIVAAAAALGAIEMKIHGTSLYRCHQTGPAPNRWCMAKERTVERVATAKTLTVDVIP
jgi:hypothetical protein